MHMNNISHSENMNLCILLPSSRAISRGAAGGSACVWSAGSDLDHFADLTESPPTNPPGRFQLVAHRLQRHNHPQRA